jgi:hypothetical protein
MGERRVAYRVLMVRSQKKIRHRRSINKCRNNNKMDLPETGWEGMDWINLARDRNRYQALLNAAINLRVS